MATSSTNMTITDKGLSIVSKSLVDQRNFDRSLINFVGTPVVNEEGLASSFSSDDYLYYSNLSFSQSDKVNIKISGTSYIPSTGYTCPISLSGDSSFLSIRCSSSETGLYLNGTLVCSIPGVLLASNDRVTFELYLEDGSVTLVVIKNNKRSVVTQSISIPFWNFTTITVGTDSAFLNAPWLGTLRLNRFVVNKNSNLYYTPTVASTFKFSNLIVSDGSFPLLDTSGDIINHMYSFPITEVSRSNNFMLLKTTIGSKAYLKIKEIGLYATYNGDEILFSLIKDLNINKSRDLDYDLIFVVNLELNVVNTYAFPSIVVEESEPTTMANFDRIKLAFLNTNIDLERAIKMNATELGYNSAQVFIRSQDEHRLWSDNWVATHRYLKLLSYLNASPENFYSIPYYPYFSFYVEDIADQSRTLFVEDNTFIGNLSTVDFSRENGFTLSTRVNPDTMEDTLFLASVLPGSYEKYFTLGFEDLKLSFKLYMNDRIVELSKSIDITEYGDFTSPFNVTIVKEPDLARLRLTMYINSQVVDTFETPAASFIDATDFALTNYTSEGAMSIAKIVVSDIVTFDKSLTSTEVRYLSNLFTY